jgi:CheY-like chemotaxis protein
MEHPEKRTFDGNKPPHFSREKLRMTAGFVERKIAVVATGPILVLEDNEDDAALLKRALQKNGITSPVIVLNDGNEGVAYLSGKGEYGDRDLFPVPNVLIIDLKMPKMGGLDFLRWLKGHPEFRVIPTIVLSSSMQDRDVLTAYQLGANSYHVKPSSFEDFQALVKTVYSYWQCCVIPTLNRPSTKQ